MISKIRISNFQSHADTELTLHQGVNAIVGSSDVGKSALIRALCWLIWNRPSGDAFRSTWGGDTSVEVELSDGTLIGRSKSNKENAYWLENTKFSAIKTDVPDEIVKALNMSEINVSKQFDRPFMLDATPGEVAAHFNRIAHLDVIDTATKNVQRWLRGLENSVAAGENTVTKLSFNLERYADLDSLENRVATLEQDAINCKQLNGSANNLSLTISKIAMVDESINQLHNSVKHEAAVNALLVSYSVHTGLTTNIEHLSDLIEQLVDTDEELAIYEIKVQKLEKEFDNNFPEICPLCGTRWVE